MATLKTCTLCNTPQPLHNFNKHKPGKDGLHPRCKSCRSGYNKQLYAKNGRKPYDPVYEKARRLRRKYGLTVEDYQRMTDAQGGKCFICDEPKLSLVVDHCHATGTIRDLLCVDCNLGLGFFKDRISSLKSAVIYLTKHGVVLDR